MLTTKKNKASIQRGILKATTVVNKKTSIWQYIYRLIGINKKNKNHHQKIIQRLRGLYFILFLMRSFETFLTSTLFLSVFWEKSIRRLLTADSMLSTTASVTRGDRVSLVGHLETIWVYDVYGKHDLFVAIGRRPLKIPLYLLGGSSQLVSG